MNWLRFSVLTAMTLAAVASRLIPHPPNFTPIAALALFGGASFGDKRLALFVPLASLLCSDLFIGFYSLAPLVYASFALIVCIGFWVRQDRNPARLAAGSLAGAVLFFALTNFGVWFAGGLYAKTLSGLIECYVAAIPFFANTVISDVLYCVILFGGLHLLERPWPALSEGTQSAA